jgi:hypothetical protein
MPSSITQKHSMRRTTRTKTISLDPDVERKGLKQARRRGFRNSFSAYVAKLILEDAEAIAREVKTQPQTRELEVPV